MADDETNANGTDPGISPRSPVILAKDTVIRGSYIAVLFMLAPMVPMLASVITLGLVWSSGHTFHRRTSVQIPFARYADE